MIKKKYYLFFYLFLIMNIFACAGELGSAIISQPDEYTYVYEAREPVILRSIAGVFKEKNIGSNVTIDYDNLRVNSDYVYSGDWRTKANARVKKLNWKECEATLAVITDKKTATGWEMRRILQKEQYYVFFNVIDLRIYEEMSKVE